MEPRKRRHPDDHPSQSKMRKPNVPPNTQGTVLYTNRLDSTCPKSSNELRFSQLLHLGLEVEEQDMCESGLLTTYSYDPEGLRFLRETKAKMCVVLHGAPERRLDVNERLCFLSPTLAQGNKFHCKCYLLKFAKCLRVVVTSANLTQCDWDSILQVIWFQDFPEGAGNFSFGAELVHFLSEVVSPLGFDIESELGISLLNYDFSAAAAHLVTSVPGSSTHPEAYGLGFMSSVLKGYSFTHCVYQATSIGSLSKTAIAAYRKAFGCAEKTQFTVIYPSDEQVKSSLFGEDGAGQFFFYQASTAPNLAMGKVTPLHEGYLSHSKVMVAWNVGIDDDTAIYVGSHNLTVAAWGPRYQNYELGLLFPPKPGSKASKNEMVSQLPIRVVDCELYSTSPYYRSYE